MPEATLAHIQIVLVEPAGGLNVGSIARVMKNMGLQRLVLVNPHCDPLGEEARLMAVRGMDILAAARQVATLPEALAGCDRAIATTARDRAFDAQLETPRSGLPWLLEPSHLRSTAGTAALIFGPEDRGLSNAELNHAQRFVRIPSSAEYASLNLAQAVAICCYELYLLAIDPPAPVSPFPVLDPPAALDALERYYQHLEAVLLKIGYLYPHTTASRMEKFRRLFNRAYLSAPEVAMLQGFLSQIEWRMQTQSAKEQTEEHFRSLQQPADRSPET